MQVDQIMQWHARKREGRQHYAKIYWRQPGVTAGFAAAQAERLKHTDFEQFSTGEGYEFVPLAIESKGRLGREASRFLSELGDIAASDGRVGKGAFVRSERQELSCALCRGNGAMYFQSTFSIAQAMGRQFVTGRRERQGVASQNTVF